MKDERHRPDDAAPLRAELFSAAQMAVHGRRLAAEHQLGEQLASQGVGVLMISQDLDEIFLLSHCVAVISQGTLSEATAITDVTPEDIGLLMGERHTEEPEDRRAST